MKTQNEVSTEKEVCIKMVVGAWETQNARVNKLIEDAIGRTAYVGNSTR